MKPNPYLLLYIQMKDGQKGAREALGISRSLINHMALGRRRVSAKVANQIHADTNGLIPREKLRPDVFCTPTPGAA